MSTNNQAVRGRSRLPAGIEAPARRLLARLAVRGDKVHLGDGLRVGLGTSITAPHGLRIGDWVSVGPRSVIHADGSIGDYALIAMGVQIVGRDDHALGEIGVPMSLATWVGDRAATPRDEVHVGRDVWIGANAVVLSGVRIGEGAVVSAGAVVVHDVEPFTIVGGNPAREIARRMSPADAAKHSAALDELSGAR
ncbi:MAG: hypothetical protein J2O46_05870 [Nocardioides sp.]|nr:hypothetical protein [Nocardioides sp.]